MKKIGPYLTVGSDYLPNMQDAYETDTQRGGSHEWNNKLAEEINKLVPTILAMAHEIENQRDKLLMQVIKRKSTGRPPGSKSSNCKTKRVVEPDMLGQFPDEELAELWGLSKHTVSNLRRKLGIYRCPRPPKLLEHWKSWDWSKNDAELARDHLITRERIRQIRESLGLPSLTVAKQLVKLSSEQEFLNWCKENHEPDNPNVIAMKRAEQSGFYQSSIHKWCLKHGFTCYSNNKHRRLSHWQFVNWDLPNWALEEAWGLRFNSVATARSRFGAKPAPYVSRNDVSSKLKALIEQEKLKAEQFRANPPEKHGRGNEDLRTVEGEEPEAAH
jgi:hypothetical protein